MNFAAQMTLEPKIKSFDFPITEMVSKYVISYLLKILELWEPVEIKSQLNYIKIKLQLILKVIRFLMNFQKRQSNPCEKSTELPMRPSEDDDHS